MLDINDQGVNSYFQPNQYRVPFRNMIYIGDSDTDIPCMKLVNTNGGHSIGVYNSNTKDKSKVFRMLEENRIKYYEPADYKKGSELEKLVQMIIDRTASNELLEEVHFNCISEKNEETRYQSDEVIQKEILINRLDDSMNFANTHEVIEQLSQYENWTDEQKNKLIKIALKNNQVTYILKDMDIKRFYKSICKELDNDKSSEILEILNSK